MQVRLDFIFTFSLLVRKDFSARHYARSLYLGPDYRLLGVSKLGVLAQYVFVI